MTARELLPGEHLVRVARQHRVVLVRPFAVTILLAAVALAGAALIRLPAELRLFILLGMVVAGLAVLNLYYWSWRAREYVLTDQRVILNQGILSRFSRSIAIDRIQDLTTYQGLWGRAWGFGDVELESAGRDSGEVLRRLPQPQEFRNAVFAQMEARRHDRGS